ncbi:NAD(P)-dependent alcohol dehydrogenase [Paenibacillus kobensis]|uniref:NAD(P)-dependent alcohol dehydrogenase n=1 Tax=Paenibacillus kobensis TaxID=59841 RepID=UPI000FDC7B6A|nr:NAD(P)-dependent alcohol dehydrogenase [Paenibacillus kobensis]
MKAVVCTKYGGPEVLQLREVEKPSLKDDEVRIQIYSTTVTAGDCRVRGFSPPPMFKIPMRFALGFTKPRKPILGVELAGVVEQTGRYVTRFKEGDHVFGSAGFAFGSYAEYSCLPEKSALAIKPAGLSFEEAAAVPVGGLTALHFLRRGNIQSGHKVLIYGASGSVGSYAVQLAKYFGAEVTGVCSSANVELVRSLGADRVIDYTRGETIGSGERYSIIFDTVGKSPYPLCVSSLTDTGTYCQAVMSASHVLRGMWTTVTSGKKVIGGVSTERPEDLQFLAGLIEAGQLKPVIDRHYSLEQIADAHRYVDQGRKKGNVVIKVR